MREFVQSLKNRIIFKIYGQFHCGIAHFQKYDENLKWNLKEWLIMKILEIKENKKQFLSLLLLADEQENMIDRYLERGTMYVLDDNGVKAECVVTDEGNGILEIKNIATVPEYQGKGYAKALINFIVKEYADKYSVLQVGTGDSPLTVPFYEKCGFVRSHIIPNFFTDNYDHPIFECDVRLVDMVIFQRNLRMFEKFGYDEVFGRSEVTELLDLKNSSASKLLSNLVQADIIEPVSGYGKGRYKFKS